MSRRNRDHYENYKNVDGPKKVHTNNLLEMFFPGIHQLTSSQIDFEATFGGTLIREVCFHALLHAYGKAAEEANAKAVTGNGTAKENLKEDYDKAEKDWEGGTPEVTTCKTCESEECIAGETECQTTDDVPSLNLTPAEEPITNN